jgi:glycosyltransferase involved in cell wall biosynthesis
MTEIVEEGRNGLLVESGNASALAEAILQLLSDDDLRKSMGKAGHQRSLELFCWERIAENLLNQYRNIFESQEQMPRESSPTAVL